MIRQCDRCGSGMYKGLIENPERNDAGERDIQDVDAEYKCPSCGHTEPDNLWTADDLPSHDGPHVIEGTVNDEGEIDTSPVLFYYGRVGLGGPAGSIEDDPTYKTRPIGGSTRNADAEDKD